MAATPSIRVVKSMSFRDDTRLWGNRYHFNGGTPADNAAWTTLADAVVTAEKATMSSAITIVHVYGYAAGSEVPVFEKAYTTAGTMSAGTGQRQAGQVAALVRYATTAKTSKNHPVYLFNYIHGVYNASNTEADTLFATQKTALETYATAWMSGFSDGTNTLVRAGPNGATAVSRVVDEYLTHHDFPI